jgi:predicted ATPase
MSKIRIKNFGPIKEGYSINDGWMDIKKVTIFIGNQGSGKSTVAKLISTFTWIEKAMVKGIIRQDELNTYNRFLKQIAYHRLNNYIQNDTEIEYSGKAYTLKFKAGIFSTTKAENNGYILPKIMYIPSERNFLSVVDRPDKLKNLPSGLYTFNDEFDNAKKRFAKGIELPINGVDFSYDKANKIAHIIGVESTYKIRLSEASSGFQSTVPLYLVSKYLSEALYIEEDVSLKENSLEEQRKLDKAVKKIMEDTELSLEVRQASLRQLSAKRKPACFINIVEEPEQNLFPVSQERVLYELLKYVNQTDGNRLIITTHSPYLINYLTLALKAGTLKEKLKTEDERIKLQSIVPLSSTISADDFVIYELDEQLGRINLLDTYNGLPSDENKLNDGLADSNEKFAQLLEIQQAL